MGPKIGALENIELLDDFMLKTIGRDDVCSVKLAWRVGRLAGVRIPELAKLPPTPHQSLGTRRGLRRG